MTLIKSISGIRGTIGGETGGNLTPPDIVRFAAAYGEWVKRRSAGRRTRVVIGRDARISGEMVNSLVVATLNGMGIDTVDLGLATTPTVEIAVVLESAGGGIIISASHNPANWNALKLLNGKGEFVSAADGDEILGIADREEYRYSEVNDIGLATSDSSYLGKHVDMILALPAVNRERIKEAGLTVAIDCVNSVGGIALPMLLERLGVKKVIGLYTEPNGLFPHNPEPLPENIRELSALMEDGKADVGFVVDPDADRLAIVCEDGTPFNEEYTLVSCADYVLGLTPGDTVSNMSSTRALREVTALHGGKWHRSAVGEVNVVEKMKEVGAVIGGEGNGGIIYPPLHYGRDALVGVALFLSHLALSGLKCSDLRLKYPGWMISKNRVDLPEGADSAVILSGLARELGDRVTDRQDGLLVESDQGWIHVRRSNTEQIIRIYAEGYKEGVAEELSSGIIKIVKKLLPGQN